MKKYLGLGLLLISINSYAEKVDMYNMHSLMIVDEKEMPFYSEKLHQEKLLMKSQVEKQGYSNLLDTTYFNFLMNIKKNAPQEKKAYKGTPNKGDTHLKESADEIKLAFPFKKLPIDDKNIIGYAPIGSYKESSPEGWNGIKIFFDNPDIPSSMCAYEFTDLGLSNGGVTLNASDVTYTVGNKPTLKGIDGNTGTGFIYTVIWYNNLKVSRIDCVKLSYDKSVLDRVLILANKIDKNGLVVSH